MKKVNLSSHRIRRLRIVCVVTLVLYAFLCHCPYRYYNDDMVDYIQSNYNDKSRCMCAWYVMKAIRNGGCLNCYIYPAYAYNKILPQLGFTEISSHNYIPKRGDISVLPQNDKSSFGHIAIYDGNNWISDFKQRSIFPGVIYENVGKYQIFRIEDGWHWAHLVINPVDIIEYAKTLLRGYKRIRLF